jgi:hypothetical protein
LISDPLTAGQDPTAFVNANGLTSPTAIKPGPFGFGDAIGLDNNKVNLISFLNQSLSL